jgi:hypothetical protein
MQTFPAGDIIDIGNKIFALFARQIIRHLAGKENYFMAIFLEKFRRIKINGFRATTPIMKIIDLQDFHLHFSQR